MREVLDPDKLTWKNEVLTADENGGRSVEEERSSNQKSGGDGQ